MKILLNACEEYMLSREMAERIVFEVTIAVKDWKKATVRLGILERETGLFREVFDRRSS